MEIDPGETINQAANPEYKSILIQHRNYLKQWAENHNDTFLRPGGG